MLRIALGFRGRIYLTTLVIVGVFGLTSGVWLSSQLRAILVSNVENNLAAHARTLANILPEGADHQQMGQLAQDFAQTTGARITIVAADGVVFADSDADRRTMDNHGSRPEILDAWGQDGYGVSMRFSDTVKKQMLYVAVPWPSERPIGVVRVSRPLNQVEEYLRNLSRVLWLGGAVGLLVSVFVAGFFVNLVTRDLRDLTQRARSLTRGSEGGGDEIAGITGSIDLLSMELRDAVDNVASERNRLQAVLSGLGEAVIALDTHGRVEVTNPSARQWFGMDAETFGKPIVDAIGLPELGEIADTARTEQRPVTGDLSWVDADNPSERRAMLVSANPQVGGGVVLVLRDVTELRRLESIRRDFVANVSHELRTPVAVIQSSAEALLDGAQEDPVMAKQFTGAIHRHTQRLTALLSDLLDLSRLEGAGAASALESVELGPLVDEVVDALTARASEKGQSLVSDVEEGWWVSADPSALLQVLTNLAENAVKYTQASGQVVVRARRDATRVFIEVCDNGPGIADLHHSRIFERFYRVDPGRSRDMGGTGLGLSIVKHLAEAQGGSVHVRHNEPRGTVFTVELQRSPSPMG